MGSGVTVKLGVVWVALLAIVLFVAWSWRPRTVVDTGPCSIATGPAPLPGIPESSGLAVSRRTPGILWTHNDSGNASVLFAVDLTGTVRAHFDLPIQTRDWEDISAGHCPAGDCLYVADIGDNRVRRQQVEIYRIPEPALDARATATPEVFHAIYADGPHNAEAMFVIGSDLFIVTKDRTGILYRSSAAAAGGRIVFERVGELGLSSVTDAEASLDEKSVVVRTYDEAEFYRTADLIEGKAVPYLRVPLATLGEGQGEGVAVSGNTLYLSSEAVGLSRDSTIRSLHCTPLS